MAIKFGRVDRVAAAMTRQKRNPLPLQCANNVVIRWGAKWRIDRYFFNVGQPFNFIKATATNDTNFYIIHYFSSGYAGFYKI
jgi:hypothetical protein